LPWANEEMPGQHAAAQWQEPAAPDGLAVRAGRRAGQRAGQRAGREVARAQRQGGRMTDRARTQLLAALADVGVEPDDYALIEDAKALVDEVNARLRARKSCMVYSVTFCAAPPPQPQPEPWSGASIAQTALPPPDAGAFLRTG